MRRAWGFGDSLYEFRRSQVCPTLVDEASLQQNNRLSSMNLTTYSTSLSLEAKPNQSYRLYLLQSWEEEIMFANAR